MINEGPKSAGLHHGNFDLSVFVTFVLKLNESEPYIYAGEASPHPIHAFAYFRVVIVAAVRRSMTDEYDPWLITKILLRCRVFQFWEENGD